MIDPAEASRAFDAAFAVRAPGGLRVRPESGDDAPFLRELFLARYPLRNLLPAPMVAQQADIRLAAFRQSYPDAMRRMVVDADAPLGRIIIDWRAPFGSHCVDIAVAPAYGRRGVGTALIEAWIDAAAGDGLACTLTVAPDNPARGLYARLGFQEIADEAGSPAVAMSRPPGPAGPTGGGRA